MASKYRKIIFATEPINLLGEYVFDQQTIANLDGLPTTKFVWISDGNFLAYEI